MRLVKDSRGGVLESRGIVEFYRRFRSKIRGVKQEMGGVGRGHAFDRFRLVYAVLGCRGWGGYLGGAGPGMLDHKH